MALKDNANMYLVEMVLFNSLPEELRLLEEFLNNFESPEDKSTREEFQEIMKSFGGSISVISHELNGYWGRNKFFRYAEGIEKQKLWSEEGMIRDVAWTLDLVVILAELNNEISYKSGTWKLPQTGEVKSLKEITLNDLIKAIPPIRVALGKRAVKISGKTLEDFKLEREKRIARRKIEVERDNLLKSSHICPHCGASKKYKEKDIIEGTNAKVICKEKKCKQEFIIQDIEELFTKE